MPLAGGALPCVTLARDGIPAGLGSRGRHSWGARRVWQVRGGMGWADPI